jgi:hypothetical protein
VRVVPRHRRHDDRRDALLLRNGLYTLSCLQRPRHLQVRGLPRRREARSLDGPQPRLPVPLLNAYDNQTAAVSYLFLCFLSFFLFLFCCRACTLSFSFSTYLCVSISCFFLSFHSNVTPHAHTALLPDQTDRPLTARDPGSAAPAGAAAPM